MVVIRLARGGAKKRPFYHVVAADKRAARDGRNIERLGYFNPVAQGKETRLNIDMERVNYWLSQGAQPSNRVSNLIKDMQKGPEAVAQALAKKAEKLQQKKAQAKAQAPSEEKAKASTEEKAEASTKAKAKASTEAKAEASTKEKAEEPAQASESKDEAAE